MSSDWFIILGILIIAYPVSEMIWQLCNWVWQKQFDSENKK